MSAEQGARLFGLGYRGYEGERRRTRWAMVTIAVFTIRRVLGLGRPARHKVLPAITLAIAYVPALVVLGLGRPARHKVLPAITLAIAYVPALVSVGLAILLEDLPVGDLITYGEYMFFIGSALALFSALIAPEALCPDRRSGMLGLYLAGPLDRNRYLLAKSAAVLAVMLLITLGPLLFMFAAFVAAGHGPELGETPELLLQILVVGVVAALGYAALSLAVSSFTTRRAAAAVGVVLVLLVPVIVARGAIDSTGASDTLDLLSFPFVIGELSYRVFDEFHYEGTPIERLSTWTIAAGAVAWIAAGALVCWLRYRRTEDYR